jgi:DnaJ homolog subfamily C member 17
MSSDNADLLRFAAEYAEKDVDLFDLLGVDALTPKEDIQRAWRKSSMRYHPDKAGASFDPEKWELFERARDILRDPNARAAYESAMKAKLLRKQEREAMDRESKKYADDLEAAENAHRMTQQAQQQRDQEVMQKERDRLAEAQRMRQQEEQRQADAELEMADLAEARRRLKEKKEEKARRKQAKDSMKAAGRPTGPVNGVVLVPGDYIVDLGSDKKQYYQLVCDKLRAAQGVRKLANAGASSEELRAAEQQVFEARQRIADAESKYQQETRV